MVMHCLQYGWPQAETTGSSGMSWHMAHSPSSPSPAAPPTSASSPALTWSYIASTVSHSAAGALASICVEARGHKEHP